MQNRDQFRKAVFTEAFQKQMNSLNQLVHMQIAAYGFRPRWTRHTEWKDPAENQGPPMSPEHTCMHVYLYTQAHTHTCTHLYTHHQAHIHTQLCVHMHTHTCTSTHPHIHACMCTTIYMHTFIHAVFTHTHTHHGSKQKSPCLLIEYQRDKNQLGQKLSSQSLSKLDSQIEGSESLFTTDPFWAQHQQNCPPVSSMCISLHLHL